MRHNIMMSNYITTAEPAVSDVRTHKAPSIGSVGKSHSQTFPSISHDQQIPKLRTKSVILEGSILEQKSELLTR